MCFCAPPLIVTVPAGTVQVVCGFVGATLQARVTDPLNPLIGVRVSVKRATFPGETVCDAGETEIEKSVPVPLRLTVCVVLQVAQTPLLSVMVSVAVRSPLVDGVKFTMTVQLPPVTSVPMQLLVCVNSPVGGLI